MTTGNQKKTKKPTDAELKEAEVKLKEGEPIPSEKPPANPNDDLSDQAADQSAPLEEIVPGNTEEASTLSEIDALHQKCDLLRGAVLFMAANLDQDQSHALREAYPDLF